MKLLAGWIFTFVFVYLPDAFICLADRTLRVMRKGKMHEATPMLKEQLISAGQSFRTLVPEPRRRI